MRYNKQITILLIVAVVIVQAIGMFLPLTGDAAKYAAVSKSIYQSGNAFGLTIHGSDYLQKPPLLMWLSSAGYFLFGRVNNFTTRLFPILFSLLMLYSTFRLAKLYYSKTIAQYATLITGTTLTFFLYNTDLHTDVILTTCTTFVIWQLAEYLKKRKWYNFLLAFVFAGGAMLTKGPIGAVVPFLAIGTHLLISRNYKMIFRPEWILGIALTILVITPYLIHLYKTFGIEGVTFYFWTNNIGTINGEYRESNSDLFFYCYNLLAFGLPWTVFIIWGIYQKLIEVKSKASRESEYFTIGGSILLIVILSFSKMQSPNYLYPAIPLLAILGSRSLVEFLHKGRLPKLMNGLIYVQHTIVLSLVVLIYTYIFPSLRLESLVGATVLILIIVFITVSFRPSTKKQVLLCLSSIILLNLAFNAQVFPEIFNYQSSLKASKIFNESASAEDNYYTFQYEQFGMFFYAQKEGRKIIDEDTFEETNLVDPEVALMDKGAWFFCDELGYHQLKTLGLNIEKEFRFENFYLTNISIRFINPKTRPHTLQSTYLIKSSSE